MTFTLTIDLEDPSGLHRPDGRYVAMTKRILDLCAETNRKATFFTVGRIAQGAPDLIRMIAAQGHEIAYHAHNHVHLPRETPARFKQESAEDKDRLEQLAGKSVLGFRAPAFSLTPQTLWALDILGELGFLYSSSVKPIEVTRYAFPGISLTPFRWPNGMVEFPLPVATLGTHRIPYLGGIYLYTLPFSFVRWLLDKKTPKDQILWTYAHPYDFDREELLPRIQDTPLWATLILRLGRARAEKQIRRVLALGDAPPLGERARHFRTREEITAPDFRTNSAAKTPSPTRGSEGGRAG